MYTRAALAWKFIEEKNADRADDLSTRISQKALHGESENSFVSFCQANFLELQAKLIHARTALIIGFNDGIEIPALVNGMNHEGQLTVVASSAQATTRAREIFDEIQETSSTKLRCVNTDAQTFLPRLNAHDYDVLVVTGDAENYTAAVQDAHRLLRTGGLLFLTDAMALTVPDCRGGVPDAADRSNKAVALREIIRSMEEDENFDSSLTPVGTGLLIAVAR